MATSFMLASPMMTWKRRYFEVFACGSSRVFTMGRRFIVSMETSTLKKSARCEIWKTPGCGGVFSPSMPILPAPAKIWRVIRKGMLPATIRSQGVSRDMR